MKFSEINYKRPDIDTLKENFNQLLDIFETADNFEIQDVIMKDINHLRMEFQTMNTLSSIHYSIDTTNVEFEEEQKFFDDNVPIYEGLIHRYYGCLINSKFKKELQEK